MKERAHLETSVNNLKIKHDKNQAVHKSVIKQCAHCAQLSYFNKQIHFFKNFSSLQDTTIIMKHNTFLIFEINHLKREKKKILEDKAKLLMLASQKKKADGTSKVDVSQLEREIQRNEEEKKQLKDQIDKLRDFNEQLKSKKFKEEGL